MNSHNFLFASLDSKNPNTARKVHIRRVYDILQLSVQRNDISRAKKAWGILARCKEFDWKAVWTLGVHLMGTTEASTTDISRTRIEFLRSLMLQHPNQKDAVLRELVLRLIQAERYKEALDELELWVSRQTIKGLRLKMCLRYLPSFPYQDNPVLHTYAGMICMYIAQETSGEEIVCSDQFQR